MRNKKPKIFIIAGEVSGDVLGGRIMRALGDAEFVGIGGENMQAAGLKSLFPMSDLAVMGIIEVAAHARTLTRRIRDAADAIIDARPDIVLTIDAPGFAKSVIKRLRKMPAGRALIADGLRFHHVVAPQVWAWREGRAKKYAQIFDALYAFFDFEVPYFTRHGLNTIAVGHPIADGVMGKYENAPAVRGKKTVSLIPGSRLSEVRRILPLMREFVEQLGNVAADYEFAIPVVETTRDYVAAATADWPVPVRLVPAAQRYDLFAKTYIAIAASGTVSAELAMIHVPAIIVYRMNPITAWLVRQVIRVKWVSLVNILLNRGVYPEFLAADARADKIVAAFHDLTRADARQEMQSQLRRADDLWLRGGYAPAALIADAVRRAIK